jgi:hypothetical protein
MELTGAGCTPLLGNPSETNEAQASTLREQLNMRIFKVALGLVLAAFGFFLGGYVARDPTGAMLIMYNTLLSAGVLVATLADADINMLVQRVEHFFLIFILGALLMIIVFAVIMAPIMILMVFPPLYALVYWKHVIQMEKGYHRISLLFTMFFGLLLLCFGAHMAQTSAEEKPAYPHLAQGVFTMLGGVVLVVAYFWPSWNSRTETTKVIMCLYILNFTLGCMILIAQVTERLMYLSPY